MSSALLLVDLLRFRSQLCKFLRSFLNILRAYRLLFYSFYIFNAVLSTIKEQISTAKLWKIRRIWTPYWITQSFLVFTRHEKSRGNCERHQASPQQTASVALPGFLCSNIREFKIYDATVAETSLKIAISSFSIYFASMSVCLTFDS